MARLTSAGLHISDRIGVMYLGGLVEESEAGPAGCRFHTRCPWKQETRCDTERPLLRVVDVAGTSDGHRVACHWAEEIARGDLQPHEVEPELVSEGFGRVDVDTSPPPEAYI